MDAQRFFKHSTSKAQLFLFPQICLSFELPVSATQAQTLAFCLQSYCPHSFPVYHQALTQCLFLIHVCSTATSLAVPLSPPLDTDLNPRCLSPPPLSSSCLFSIQQPDWSSQDEHQALFLPWLKTSSGS